MKLLRQTILLFTLALCACASLPPPIIPMPKKEPPATRFEHQHPRVILVLGSGSARGFSHVGVIKVLQQNHIPIDMIIGTSAGSIVGVLYADNPSALDLEQTLLTAKRDEVIDFSYLNIIHGPVSGTGLQRFLLNNLSVKNFDELQIPFAAIATDLQTGERHVFASGPIPPAINASSAAPPFFRPVVLYGKTYIDGGVVDPVAVDIAERFHPDIIIAVNLDYPLTATLPTNGPSVFLKGFEMMLLELSKKTAIKANIIIEPNTGNIDMFEEGGRARLMQAGADAATKALPKIKRLLAEKNIKN